MEALGDGVHSSGTVDGDDVGDGPPPAAPVAAATGAALSTLRLPPANSAFLSLRFGALHNVVSMAEQLRKALRARGADGKLINMTAGGDIDTEVFQWIEHCDTFIVFGSSKYGEDTGNQACTCVHKAALVVCFCVAFSLCLSFPSPRADRVCSPARCGAGTTSTSMPSR